MDEAAARVPHLLRFSIISLNTLARPGAVLEPSPAQVDIKRRLVKLNPDGRRQTKKYRTVAPISETLLPWVEPCYGPRFVLYRGKPAASVKGSFGLADAGLKDVSPYCLRHIMSTKLPRSWHFPNGRQRASWDTRAKRLARQNATPGSGPIISVKQYEPSTSISLI